MDIHDAFFDKKNIQIIYNLVFEIIKREKLNYELPNDFTTIFIQIIKHTYNNESKNKCSLNHLNKKAISNTLNVLKNYQSSSILPPTPSFSLGIDHSDIEKNRERFMEERERNISAKPKNALYEFEENNLVSDINNDESERNELENSYRSILSPIDRTSNISDLSTQIPVPPITVSIPSYKKIKRIVNSNTRDKKLHTESHNFTIPFPCKNVHSIKLLSVLLPKSDYIINELNNKLYFKEKNDKDIIVNIPVGNYTIDDLLKEISICMNEIGKSNYSINRDKKKNKITILSNPESIGEDVECFTISKESTILKVLGFSEIDHTNALSYSSIKLHEMNERNNIILDIPELNRIEDNTGRPFCTAMINMQNTLFSSLHYEIFDEEIELGNDNFYPNIESLSIKFTDYDGNLYNFHKRDCVLVFEISIKE